MQFHHKADPQVRYCILKQGLEGSKRIIVSWCSRLLEFVELINILLLVIKRIVCALFDYRIQVYSATLPNARKLALVSFMKLLLASCAVVSSGQPRLRVLSEKVAAGRFRRHNRCLVSLEFALEERSPLREQNPVNTLSDLFVESPV